MKENKNIERLFQEKFKDFEVSPPDFIWENIQEKLHPKEKKRRVIPFWFKTAGIAASFVALVSVVFFSTNNGFKNTNTNHNTNTIVNSEITKEHNTSNQNANKNNASEAGTNKSNSDINKELESTSKATSLVNTNSTKIISDSKTDSKLDNSIQNSKTYKSKNGFVSNNKKQINTGTFKKNKTQFNTNNSQSIANTSDRNKSNNGKKSNSDLNGINSTKNNSSNTAITDLNAIQNTNSNAAVTNINSSNSSNATTKNNNEVNGVVIENSNINSTSIVAVEEIKTDTTTLATTIIEENPMEKLLREKETKKVADEKENWSKWAVNSYVSPVFFNSFSSGSPLSEEFASNEKTFNTSASYGIGVAYNVNKRLSIKTGISNLNLDYDTENIAFYSSFEDQSKIANTNIERNANGKYLVLKNENDISKNEAESQFIPSNQNLGNLNQRTQYIEIPVEMSYALLNKKIGLSIRGGMSTLFLTENEVSIKAPDGNMQIGKASNLNNVHFSSNIGLGLNYNFMKNFQLNVEPTLKYQINTFNKNSQDFTPYVIGVNTGVSYKF